ncbi:MAG: SOS response-associated peptidase [Microbacteriaceae bacterium]|jgi:putative SOS response-associated peptidase YedK
MCGRYVVARTLPGEMPELLSQLPGWPENFENFNIAPTSEVPIVLESLDPVSGKEARRAEMAHWGFVPRWKQSFTERPQPINARIETVATNGMFRKAFQTGRCIVPASGYYEWHTGADGVAQPYFIHDSRGLAFAGITEVWRSEEHPARRSIAILTRPAVGPAAQLHERLPVMLTSDAYAAWLRHDGTDTPGALDLLMAESDKVAEHLEFHPVDRRVGNVRNSGPDLCAPVDLATSL